MSTSSTEGVWDLVVVGHGAAGLTAAVAFLENHDGAAPRVAVLDRAPVDSRGGSTAWTTAGFRLDDDGQLAEDWGRIVRETGGDQANTAYIENLYENAVDTLNWLRERGVRTLTRRNASIPGGFSRHSAALEGGGRAFVDTFAERAASLGAQLFYEVDLVGLDREPDGPVTGVRVRTVDGAEQRFATRAVVLACGGFEADRERVAARIPNGELLDVVSPGTRVNSGAGIDAAVAIGAATAGQYGGSHLEPVDPRSELPEPLVFSWRWGILVNPRGERLFDEAGDSPDLSFDYAAKRVLADGGRAFAINDASVRRDNPYIPDTNRTEVASVKADTLEELAAKLEIDAEGLRRTVDAYNAAASDHPYRPTTLDGKHTVGIEPPKSHWAQPLTEAPFEAWPVVAQICFTFHGLKVDGTTHVLDTADRPIEGLHAAGEIVGTFYGDTYPAATSVLRSLTFGRLAGLEVAGELRPTTTV
jgi:tricarballylate dehydrogenase